MQSDKQNSRFRYVRLTLLLLVLIGSFVAYYQWFDRDTGEDYDIRTALERISVDPDYEKYFGNEIDKLAKLDTDKDGTPDVADIDIDGDGTPNTSDQDIDGDGASNADDPSSALVAIIGLTGQNGRDGRAGQDGATGRDGPAGQNGTDGMNGSTGSDGVEGVMGPQGATGTVGIVTDDGIIDTSLTGSDLDIQLMLATGSGLQKLSSGLSLTTTCASDEILKWNGTTWGCSADQAGITYTAGDGINITGNAISSILGNTIDTTEILDGTITTTDLSAAAVTNSVLASDSVTSDKIQDGAVTFIDMSDNGCATGQTMKYSGTNWACAADIDTDTTYTAGAGLSLVGTEFKVDPSNLPAISSFINSDVLVIGTSAGAKKITYNDLFSNILGALNYRGTWNANTNSPNLTSYCDITTKGHYYVVSGPGTTSLGGFTPWANNDWVICDGSSWQQIQSTNDVNSVFGRTGPVTAQSGDYTASQITNVPVGSISSTTVQTALNELATETLSNSLTSGKIYVGNASDTATAVTVTGDITLLNTGAVSVNANTINSAKIIDGSIVAADIATGGITTTQILDGTISGADLATSAVTSAKILDATIATADLANNAVTGAKILDGTVLFADLSANGCTTNQIVKRSATAWICAADNDSLSTISCSSNQVVWWDSALSVWQCSQLNTYNITDGTIDLVDLAFNSVSSAKIVDGTIITADVANDAITTGKILDGTILFGDLASNGCTNGQIAKYNGTAWVCAADDNMGATYTAGAGVTIVSNAISATLGTDITSSEILDGTVAAVDVAADTLDYSELKDSLALDATTTTSLGANNIVINLNSTGDYLIQDNGTTVLSILDDGSLLHKNAADSISAFRVENAAGTDLLNINTTAGTVQIGDVVADATAALLILDTKNTSGDPPGTNGAMYYNSNMGKFRCHQNNIWIDCITAAMSWSTDSAMTIGATTTAPTKATTKVADYIRSRQIQGNEYKIEFKYAHTNATGAAIGNGDYLFTLPNGLSFDPVKHPYYSGGTTDDATGMAYAIPDAVANVSANGYNAISAIVPYDSTHFRVFTFKGDGEFFRVGSSSYSMTWSTLSYNGSFSIFIP